LNKEKNIAVLNKYFLENISPKVYNIITENDFYFKISKKRCSKYGDFKPSLNGRATITVNNDLDKDHFLVTFLHEYAHFNVWKKIKNLQNPHGELWKLEFYKLLYEFHQLNGFSNGIGEKLLEKFFDSKGNAFEIIEKRRTRFLCRNIKTKRLFLIHGLFKINSN